MNATSTARDRYTQKEKDNRSGRARVCMQKKNYSLARGLLAQSSGLNTWLSCAHMSVSPGVRHMQFAALFAKVGHLSDHSAE